MSISPSTGAATRSPAQGNPHQPGAPLRCSRQLQRLPLLVLAAMLLLLSTLAPAAAAEEPGNDIDIEGEVLVASDTTVNPIAGEGTGFLMASAGSTTAVEESTHGNNYVLGDSVDPGLPSDFSCGTNPWSAISAFEPTGVNDGEVSIETPFPINFYGQVYNDLTVGVNGGILMGAFAGDVGAANTSLATNSSPGVFPFWDNLDFDVLDANHMMYICTDGFPPSRQFKVIWFQVDCLGCVAANDQTATFEVVFYEQTGRIAFNYTDTDFAYGPRDHGDSATIGIDSGIGGHLEYSFNEDTITANPFTIQFWPAFCHGQAPTLVGTRASEVLDGTNGDDVIAGYAGNDEINGYGGDDMICGGGGNDRITAGDGDDNVWGNSGNDRIRLEAGNDVAEGNDGDDVIRGGDGNDQIEGNDGDDVLRGNDGDDGMIGGDGDDVLRGGAGGDLMTGSAGDDLVAGQGDSDQVYGGDGNDVVRGNAGSDLVVGDAGDDTLRGGGGGDEVHGDEGNDTLRGGGGPDWLHGGDGDDDLAGGSSDDTLNGWAGTDECRGNGGIDSAFDCESFSSIEI